MRYRVAGALLAGLGLVGVLGTGPAGAQGLGRRSTGPSLAPPPLSPRQGTAPAAPARRGPVVREVPLVVGALIPVVGPASWYGEEIRRGLELALARVNPPPPPPARTSAATPGRSGAGSPSAGSGPGSGSSTGDLTPGAPPREESARSDPTSEAGADEGRADEPGETTVEDDPASPGPRDTPETGTPQAEAPEAEGSGGGPGPRSGSSGRGTSALPAPLPPRLRVSLKVENADPRDAKALAQAWERLLAAGASVVVTASPAPTLAVYPLASGRDVLVVNQGFRTERFPAQSRVLLHTRPSPADLGRAAAAYARERGVRRLAVLAAGGDAGRATRTALAEAWRATGGALVFDESLAPDSPDVPARLRRLAGAGAEGVILAYRGEELGDLAARIRGAGLLVPLLVLDDDPVAALAGGPDLADVLVVSDAYVDPGDGEPFPAAYRAKHGREPSRFAAHAYETATLVARAAETLMRGGKALGGGRLRETLRTVAPPSQAFGGPVGFRDDGTLSRPLALSSVERSRVHFIRYLDRPAELGPVPAPTTR